eukprot:CAMPEP_0113654424 /NCGR_PEP_ID=MMETSP0017_2-20120614/29149_1 /TAXON_ID=2856 /ORGANISM="Cylindrotheca closterium" /LENGTH=805 /DNA_ID=CAMNT_0000567571 /DNA_START=29 /DNA_END=2446 /DNA_ORIENTATION=- /assembly_acc=CAM_ASM_000147
MSAILPRWIFCFKLRLLFLLAVLSIFFQASVAYELETPYSITLEGPDALAEGQRLFAEGNFDRAAIYFWRAVLLQEQNADAYSVEDAFTGFIQSYSVQDRTADGFVYIAKESLHRGQKEMAETYLQQALAIDSNNEGALELQRKLKGGGREKVDNSRRKKRENKFQPNYGTPEADRPLDGKTPEELYEYGSTLFSRRNYEHCADVFELSCKRSNYQLGASCSNAVYCRHMIMDWGFNGTDFDGDLSRLITITKMETESYRQGDLDSFSWQRAASVHPHMMLGYPLDPMLKRYTAESVAFLDETMARVSDDGSIKALPEDLPFDHTESLAEYVAEASEPGFRLKVGFVGSGFNSKAVLYLSQDIFRFYDRTKIEMHIFSVGPADSEQFIKVGMRGVDWRERVKGYVDHFHDVQDIKMDHIALARYVNKLGIHILVEWDGYARQGERAQGLMALRPSPIQVLHQEFIGTSGAKYVDYLFSDEIASPPHLSHLYTEKIIYLPNHFFSKGHAVQKEVKDPTYEYLPAEFPYKIGTGSPEENRCMASGIKKPTFVFCNFNKFLKNNPETVRSWIRILREVPGSILCLLENPTSGVNYLRRFVHEASGEPSSFVDPTTKAEIQNFDPKDGDSLNERIHFLKWERNPFDHQQRNQDFCHVMLDSFPYNGHTVAQDALYGGVPIVTRSDGDDMSSRVTTSANLVLGLEGLNAYGGTTDYENIAISLGTNQTKYQELRKRLIGTALQRNPMHPYWDAPRYAKNLQQGFILAYDKFLSGQPPDHITVLESNEAARGTYDGTLDANSPDNDIGAEL